MIKGETVRIQDTPGNFFCKKVLFHKFISENFSPIKKEGWNQLTPKLYSNPNTLYYHIGQSGYEYVFTEKKTDMYFTWSVISDISKNGNYVLTLDNNHPYNGAHSYIFYDHENSTYKSIPDFGTYDLWGFDSRNRIYRFLTDGLLIILVTHRDMMNIKGGCEAICHDTKTNARWNVSIDPTNFERDYYTKIRIRGKTILFGDTSVSVE
jgi:hypothetical protein